MNPTTPNGRAVTLRPVELLACWEALQLGEPPYLLRLRQPGGPAAARDATRAALARALVGLAVRGHSDDTRPHPDLAAMLRVLARPSYHLDIRYGATGGHTITGHGVVADTAAVLVTRIEDTTSPLELRTLRPAQIPALLLGMPGPLTPGIGPPVNLPAEVFDQAHQAAGNTAGWALADELTARGIPRSDAAALIRMTTGLTLAGQLGASTWHNGREHRGPWVIGFVANNTGGTFLQLRRRGTVTMCPTDTARLLQQCQDLRAHTR